MMTKKQDEPAYHIKGVDLVFGDEQASSVGETIQLADIVLPAKQPRRYFDSEQIKQLADSIKKNGVLQPLLVRPKGSEYELVAGERRYRASKEAGLVEVPVIVKNLTDIEAVEIALLENLQREDLNPIEETEGILELLSLKIDTPQDTVISYLHLANHSGRKSAEEVTQHPHWQVIIEVLEVVGYTPNSFRSNRLPLLNLPSDVLQEVRQGNLEYTKARVIGRIKDDKKRRKLLEVAVKENLSLTQIKERIANLKQQKKQGKVTKLLSRMSTVYKKANKEVLWQEPEKQQRLEAILDELEGLLKGE